MLKRGSWRLLAFATIAAWGCSESTSPPKPASVSPTLTTTIDGTAGLPLTASPTFVVKDQNGQTLGDVAVTIVVAAGGGTLPDAPTKTVAGSPTSIGTWTLGKLAGLNSVTVTVAGLPPITINVNGKAGPAAAIVFVAGANQQAFAGVGLPVTPVAQVRDQFGNGVAGVPVVFTIAVGDGTVSGTPVITDALGNAAATSFKLGKTAIPQTLRASTAAFSALLNAGVQTDFNVDLRFFGDPMPDSAAAAFTNAAARIRASIVGDIPDINVTTPTDMDATCGATGQTFAAGILDDVVIYAAVRPIDGVGKILAFSGPCLTRTAAGGGLTAVGVMIFDTDDIQNLIARGTLKDVILHEMLHVVGLGTLWQNKGILAGARTLDSRFTGVAGVAACGALGGTTICPGSIPVENCSNCPGTADSHWRESTFGTELMTGFVSVGVLNPYSIMSIQSLADEGYAVNPAAADAYNIPGVSVLDSRARGNVLVGSADEWETVTKPRMFISRTGKLTPVEKQ